MLMFQNSDLILRTLSRKLSRGLFERSSVIDRTSRMISGYPSSLGSHQWSVSGDCHTVANSCRNFGAITYLQHNAWSDIWFQWYMLCPRGKKDQKNLPVTLQQRKPFSAPHGMFTVFRGKQTRHPNTVLISKHISIFLLRPPLDGLDQSTLLQSQVLQL